MKKIFSILFVILFASAANAQWMVQPFETAAADTFFHYPQAFSGLGAGWVRLSDTTVAKQGSKSLKEVWHVRTQDSWGGFVQLMKIYSANVKADSGKYYDWSPAKYISIWYKNLVPSSKPGSVEMRFKIHEAGGASKFYTSPSADDHEDWYFQTKAVYDNPSTEWQQLIVPLKANANPVGASPDDQGFTLPKWSGISNNETLDLDKIVGFSLEATSLLLADSVADGIILWDNLQLMDTYGQVIDNFDVAGSQADYWVLNGNSTNSTITLSDEKTAPFEGVASMKVDWKVDAKESWGGYANMYHLFPTPLDLSASTALYLYAKVNTAYTGVGKVNQRFILFDDDGTREEWMTKLDIDLSQAGDWKMLRIPLDAIEPVNDWGLTPLGFKLPQGISDGQFHLKKIAGYKIEYSADVTTPFAAYAAEGSVSFDLLSPAGYRETDNVPPTPPTGLSVIAGTYSNLINWTDVADETGEKYDVYYSTKPIPAGIKDLETNSDIEVVKLNIPENTSFYEHLLRAPNTDQNVTYYYAVTCNDSKGNRGDAALLATPTTNMAKGVPTISLKVPANFKADGDISEFVNAGIKPISISVKDGTGFAAPNTKIDGDDDCSVLAYLAIDKDNLYVAFDVTDDVVDGTTAADDWMRDAPDLFIGLFNAHGFPHTSLLRGANPDYHFRFNKSRVRFDTPALDTIFAQGENYYWGEKTSAGYTVEMKVSLNDMAKKRNSGNTLFDDVFVPVEGMRIPIDFSINDADLTGSREGILTYSITNEDKSYQDPSRWTYTWLGDKMTVGVNDKENTVVKYALSQNYPNPFNPSTTIKYSLEKPGMVSLKVYDALGRQVASLVNEVKNAGNYEARFDASKLTSGVYFYRLESGSFSQVSKMMLIK